MQIKHYIVVLIALLFVTNSCVEEYWPELDAYENLLVVEGMISDQPGPYTVKLSLSLGLDDTRKLPVEEAVVIISDDQGNSEVLFQIEPGTYATAEDGIQGVVGRKYALTVTTSDKEAYQSEYEELKAPVGIELVEPKIESREVNNSDHSLVGYQFYVNTSVAERDSLYYLWKLEETYEYNSDFYINHIYEGSLEPFMSMDSLFTCWRTEKLADIYTYSATDVEVNQLRNFPINFVSTDSRRLSIKYSLLVKQLVISERAYHFWSSIRDMSVEQGSLYSSVPYQIKGNVTNINDSEEPVLGYFFVAGVSEKRIFVDRPFGVDFYYNECYPDYDAIATVGLSSPQSYPIYFADLEDGIASAPDACFDCTLKGGTTEIPDFWPQ